MNNMMNKYFEKWIEDFCKSRKHIQLSVGISDGGVHKTFLYTSDGKTENKKMSYEIGSITKVVTGLLVAKAINESKISLNDRIEEISHVIDFENINNRNISLYRVNYRLKSLTPENILMAGGMDATEDGWIYTFSPNATYLIFENNELYLCDVLINDAQPHTEVFKQDVERRLLELDNE